MLSLISYKFGCSKTEAEKKKKTQSKKSGGEWWSR